MSESAKTTSMAWYFGAHQPSSNAVLLAPRDIACRADGGSGCFVAGFGEGEPLVAEIGDDLQAAAEGFDVGGQGAQFGGAWLGMLDGGHTALGDAHPSGDLGLGDAEAAAH